MNNNLKRSLSVRERAEFSAKEWSEIESQLVGFLEQLHEEGYSWLQLTQGFLNLSTVGAVLHEVESQESAVHVWESCMLRSRHGLLVKQELQFKAPFLPPRELQ